MNDRIKEYIKKLKNVSKRDTKNKISNLIILVLVGVFFMLGGNILKNSNGNSKSTMISNINNNEVPQANSIKETNKDTDKNIDKSTEEYEKKLEMQLKDSLERLDGVGKVDLMIYFEGGEEKVPAVNINDSQSNTKEEDTSGGKRNIEQKNNGSTVVVTNEENGTTKPLILKTYKPKVMGVFIIAEGADEKVTELRITKAVMTLFNLSPDKVNVYPMKK